MSDAAQVDAGLSASSAVLLRTLKQQTVYLGNLQRSSKRKREETDALKATRTSRAGLRAKTADRCMGRAGGRATC